MKVSNYITEISKSPEDSKLDIFSDKVYSALRAYVNSFRSVNFLVDLEREHYIKDTTIKASKALNEVNRIYRQDFLGVSPDYKRENLTVWSYAGKMLVDAVADTFGYKFNKRNYKDRVKINATQQKLHDTFIMALAFLFAKCKTIYRFHLYATLLKVVVDFFDYESLKDCDILNEYVQTLETDIEDIIDKIKKLGLTPAVKVKKTRPKKDRVDFPPKEHFEQWLASGQYTVTQLKDIIARQYKVSAKTVQRKLAEYGLTRKYNKI